MTLNTMSRRAWRNELQFPYHNLKDIETALIRQRRRLTHLSRLVDELVQEWRGLYPRDRSQKALMPFYLCRMQQRSNTLLRWRASHANKPLLQRRIHLTAASLDEFDTAIRQARQKRHNAGRIGYISRWRATRDDSMKEQSWTASNSIVTLICNIRRYLPIQSNTIKK